jgi:hypothetical protein
MPLVENWYIIRPLQARLRPFWLELEELLRMPLRKSDGRGAVAPGCPGGRDPMVAIALPGQIVARVVK